MTPLLRAAWLSFRRIHLTALIADWRRTLLSVVGVALGVTVVLGVLILKSEMVRPFDAFGPALTHAADAGVVQITPKVDGRLPVDLVERVRRDVTDARAVIPVVTVLTPAKIEGQTRGFLLLGGSCEIEMLVGPFDCEKRARSEAPADGPGAPLQIPGPIAQRHGLALGDELRVPGLMPGAAHVGWIFPDFDRVKDINDGYVLLAPSYQIASKLVGTPGYVSGAFVVPKPGVSVSEAVTRAVAGQAVVAPPRAQQPVVFTTTAQSFNLTEIAGVLIGVLIAVNTVLLAIEDRRPVLGTIAAAGARPLGIFTGLVAEGALIGVIGGLMGLPLGFALGQYLVDRFGRSMLAGSGGTVAAHFHPELVAVAALAGIGCGVLAMMGPAIRLAREGPLSLMTGSGGAQRARTARPWTLIAGVVALVAAAVLITFFGTGSLPLTMGSNAMTIGLIGTALVTAFFAPRAAERLANALGVVHASVSRLLSADIRRYAVLFALSAAVLALGASLAVGSQTMQVLGTAQVAAEKPTLLPNTTLVSAQSVLDQRMGQIDGHVLDQIRSAAAGRPVSVQRRATVSAGANTHLIMGVQPGDWYPAALFQPATDPDDFWKQLGAGHIGLSEVAAARLHARAGDAVELPTVHGPRRYQVAGVFRPAFINDTTIGDVVLVNDRLAQTDWAAVRDQVAVRYSSDDEAKAHRSDFLAIGAGLSVYDNATWKKEASAGIRRFFEPFTITGYVVMGAAGLSILNVFVLGLLQRRRERAVLRAVGATVTHERAVVLGSATLLAVIVSFCGALGGMGLTYLESAASPVYYGVEIGWGVAALPLVTGVVTTFVLALAAAVYPIIHAGRLEAVELLRGM